MYREIFFCDNNVSKGLDGVIKRIEKEYPDVMINIEDCLSNCGYCAEGLYAMIDAVMVTGHTPDELYDNIVSFLLQAEHGNDI